MSTEELETRPARDTTNYGWPVPGDTDAADVVTNLGALADAVDAEMRPATFRPGDVKMSAIAVTPPGWIFCNGAAVSRETFADLFAAIGTAYGGGNGVTTFNVPNFLDRVPIGAGSAVYRGWYGGAWTHTLSWYEMPYHNHDLGYGNPICVQYMSGHGSFAGVYSIGGGIFWLYGGAGYPQSYHAGGNYAHNNVQPSTGINFFIKT